MVTGVSLCSEPVFFAFTRDKVEVGMGLCCGTSSESESAGGDNFLLFLAPFSSTLTCEPSESEAEDDASMDEGDIFAQSGRPFLLGVRRKLSRVVRKS